MPKLVYSTQLHRIAESREFGTPVIDTMCTSEILRECSFATDMHIINL